MIAPGTRVTVRDDNDGVKCILPYELAHDLEDHEIEIILSVVRAKQRDEEKKRKEENESANKEEKSSG